MTENRYLIGFTGPGVVVPGRVAAVLDKLLDLREIRTQLRGYDAELDGVLVAMATAAAAWRASATGRPERTSPDPLPEWITTAKAADVLYCDPRHVRRLIAEGKLTGQQITRGWLVETESVQMYRAARAA